MALRTLLWFGETPGKCWFNKIHPHQTLSEVPSTLRHSRGFKRLRGSSHGSVPTSLGSTEVSVKGQLWKPLGFTILFGSTVHVGATVWEYERMRNLAYNQVMNRFQPWKISKTGWRAELEAWWRGLSEAQRVFAPICFLNVMVFLAWRIPAWRNTMTRYFLADPNSKSVCLPMLLSTFSHTSPMHLGVNMYVLYNFGTLAIPTLGTEQFAALYLTSGVIASFASHMYKIMVAVPGMSLGASGAIMGTISFVCMQYPDLQLAIVFLPMFGFNAGIALKGLICMDSLGCILRWRFFDHAAHLGGALWGLFWQSWGCAHIWQKREPILTFWHGIRNPKKPN